MDKYQGDEIAFNLELYTDGTESNKVNIDDIADVVIYVYTDICKIAKFSKTNKEGYLNLIKNNAYQYAGVLGSEFTKLMSPGTITMEIRLAYTSQDIADGFFNVIQKASIGQLIKSTIKIEA